MNPDISRVCVTGGAGFIGSTLVRKLMRRGYQVAVLDNFSVGRKENVPSGAEIVEGDILDPEIASKASEYDAVIHLAARVAIRSSFEFVVDDTMTNVVGTANLLNALHRNAGNRVRKFLFASSMAVYAESSAEQSTSEEHALDPASPYGISKLAAEMLVRQMCQEMVIDAGILRLFNTYGVGQALSPYVGVVTIFADAMRKGETPRIFGDGQQKRDFVHVEDVASGFICALERQTAGKAFNIGSGKALTINEVYRTLAGQLGFTKPASHVKAVPGELRFSVADIEKARSELNYEPDYSFTSSIGQVISGQRG